MQSLNSTQCQTVSGGLGAEMLIGSASLVGGVIAAKGMSYLEDYSTVFGTIGLGASAALFCTPFAPVIGTVGCGCAGSVLGYLVSSKMANVGAFAVGAIAAGAGMHSFIGA